MAKRGESFIPPGPTAAAGAPAEPSPATLAFGTVVQAAGEAAPAFDRDTSGRTSAPAPAAAAAPAPAVAPAGAPPAPKKPSARASELGIMQQIARRMKKLPSDAARARVAGWFAEEFGEKGGGDS